MRLKDASPLTTVWWLAPLFVALAALPLLAFPFAPYPDVLGHIGRYAIQLNIDTDATLVEHYDFRFRYFGNIGFDFLVQHLGPVVGMLAVVKWTTVVIPPLTVLGLALVAKEALGRIPATFGFAAIFAFNFPFFFGFLNYTLAMALALLAFAGWMWLRRIARPLILWLLFLPVGLVIYYAHVFGWGMLGLFVFGYELERRREDFPALYRRIIPSALATAPLWAPLIQLVFWRTSMSAGGIDYLFRFDLKLASLPFVLRDKNMIADLLFLVPAVALIIQALRKDDFSFDAKLIRMMLPATLVYLVMPGTLFGSAYADTRMIPYILMVLVLAVRADRFPKAIAIAGLVLFAVRVGVVFLSAQESHREIERVTAIIEPLPHGSRLLQLNRNPCPLWAASRLQMIGAMHLYHNAGFTNATWDMGGANPLTVTYDVPSLYRQDPHLAATTGGCEDPDMHLQGLLEGAPRDLFDYILVIGARQPLDLPSSDRLIASTPEAQLFEIRLADRPNKAR